MERVAQLLDEWAVAEGLDADARARQTALGWLHDSFKGASRKVLRKTVPRSMRKLPEPILHGPAAAALLEADGVDDEAFLLAIRYHTLGHPKLDSAGRSLYAADFLEPGRNLRNKWRAKLRARMPDDREAVIQEILEARMTHLLARGRPIQKQTVRFWNSLVEES